MNSYIALLRGINVGGRNKLLMKTLIAHLETLGAQHVQTYIQSGNAVFQHESTDPQALPTRIERVPPAPNLKKLASLKGKTELFVLLTDLFYLHTPDGISRSKLAAKAEKCLGVSATARNWRTLSKLQAMTQAT